MNNTQTKEIRLRDNHIIQFLLVVLVIVFSIISFFATILFFAAIVTWIADIFGYIGQFLSWIF